MTTFSKTITHIARNNLEWLSKRATAPDQGGLLTGKDPTAYNPSDPLRIWIIQVGVILMTTQLLSLLLRKMHQPRVIAEVLGGILLGPTAFGRIPGFTEHIFPSQSIPYLSLAANIGLVLFLFLVGLEIDTQIIKRNARLSVTISLAGMILPFGLGAAYSLAIYKEFVDPSTQFTHFLLFVGVAFSITAFPVLCRILTELKLVDTTVGVVVLSAGVGNDLVGWVLLALSVALVNASTGLTALWILLACVGWTLFLLFIVRRAVVWLAHRTGSIENGPTTFFMTAVMLMVFASAFFTDVIGVNAIFGGFLVGLIIPREGGLAISLTEKLEDMVSIIFLPIYFTLSGLSTNLGLLNNGITWAYTIGIVVLAYVGKFGGCTIAARFIGFQWREAATIGTLMSCKGLIELIVLNVGLAAGILDTRVFSMFVLEALVLTFMTTPIAVKLYPPQHRKRAAAYGSNFNGIENGVTDEKRDGGSSKSRSSVSDDFNWRTRFTVVLDKVEHLPGLMTVSQLFRPVFRDSTDSKDSSTPSVAASNYGSRSSLFPTIDALRLIELSDRTSAVMKSNLADSLIHTDPIVSVFRAFGELNNFPVSSSLSVVPWMDLGASVAEHAHDNSSQLVLIPWLPPSINHHHTDHHLGTNVFSTTNNTNAPSTPVIGNSTLSQNPFDTLFHFGITEQSASALHAQFVRSVFSRSKVDVALYVDCGNGKVGPGHQSRQRIFMPFFGGPDDRLALELVVQLCSNPWTTAKVVRVKPKQGGDIPSNNPSSLAVPELVHYEKDKRLELPSQYLQPPNISSLTGVTDTVYGSTTTQTRMESETADNITWQNFAGTRNDSFVAQSPEIRSALTRIQFTELDSYTPLHDLLHLCESEVSSNADEAMKSRPFIIVGRGRKLSVGSHTKELNKILEEKGTAGIEIKKTMGDVATAVIASGLPAGLLVVQAGKGNNNNEA
ncbi:hypothetical protein Clacol_010155 [Clathrus columnatus]|uniref:Cation/H+ exchanger transmembrane domain-containing protein n=1 Tax=Clathrus columnatus TaxID=1419009 RepID=A0AAV5AQ03_9AGAM|nr:hypothetical protein Clacol_010155 [Clathrus columnatus]